MEFHPGGVEELMKGVGTDATKMFNEVKLKIMFNCFSYYDTNFVIS